MPATRATAVEDWKVQLSLKRGNDMVNLRGKDVAEVEGLFTDLANGELARFAEEEEEQAPRPTATASRSARGSGRGSGTSRTRSTRRGSSSGPEVAEEGGCPIDGGDLVKRFRKDGSGSFVGCANFPDCDFIEND